MIGRRFIPRTILCGAFAALGCSGGSKVNIGSTTTLGSTLSDYAASWTGYAEAYTFVPSGSDEIRLTIAADGEGTLQVGNGATLAPPTNPAGDYPPGYEPYVGAPLWEGYPYPIHSAQIQEARIQLGIDSNDLFSGWCALQTPMRWSAETTTNDAGVTSVVYAPSDGSVVTYYSCAPIGQTSGSDAGCAVTNSLGVQPVDCLTLALCGQIDGVCICDATACAAEVAPAGTPPAQYPIELDAALDDNGSILDGTLVISDTRVTVRLQKQ